MAALWLWVAVAVLLLGLGAAWVLLIQMLGQRGRRLLLVQWSPSCSFCEQLAPELADLQLELRAHQIEPVLVSDGDAKANRRLAHRYGLDARTVLQPDSEQVAAFKG